MKEHGITNNLKPGRDTVWVASLVKGKSVAVHRLLKPAPNGARYTFVDKNPLNLKLENIVVTLAEPKVQKPTDDGCTHLNEHPSSGLDVYARKEWDQGALKLKDREIEDAERFYRDSAECCRRRALTNR